MSGIGVTKSRCGFVKPSHRTRSWRSARRWRGGWVSTKKWCCSASSATTTPWTRVGPRRRADILSKIIKSSTQSSVTPVVQSLSSCSIQSAAPLVTNHQPLESLLPRFVTTSVNSGRFEKWHDFNCCSQRTFYKRCFCQIQRSIQFCFDVGRMMYSSSKLFIENRLLIHY